MKFGDTKYYKVKQILENGKCIGNIVLIGRCYGYIVQLHYFNIPGYKINKCFSNIFHAENYFYKVLKEETQNNKNTEDI